MDKVVLGKAVTEGSSAGALAAIAAAPFLSPDKAAAIGAIVTLAMGAWKAYRANRQQKHARKQRRRASDLG